MNIFVTVERRRAAENTASLSEAACHRLDGGDDVVGPEVAQFGRARSSPKWMAKPTADTRPAITLRFFDADRHEHEDGVISHGERAPQEVSALRDASWTCRWVLGSAQSTRSALSPSSRPTGRMPLTRSSARSLRAKAK